MTDRVGYVVESVISDSNGERSGVARIYVATEARAQEIANACPGRTYRALSYDDMPIAARENMERANREKC